MKAQICFACKSLCINSNTIYREINKEPVLIGYSPGQILEAYKTALKFWEYQTEQELTILNAIHESAENVVAKAFIQMKNIKCKHNLEIELLKHTLLKTEKALDLEKRKNIETEAEQKENNRQYEKFLKSTSRQKRQTKLCDITNLKKKI